MRTSTLAIYEVSLRKDISPAAWHINQEDAKPLGRDVKDVGRTTTPRRSARLH